MFTDFHYYSDKENILLINVENQHQEPHNPNWLQMLQRSALPFSLLRQHTLQTGNRLTLLKSGTEYEGVVLPI